MIEETLSTTAARHFYDRIGRLYDATSWLEARARQRALAVLQLEPGLRVLNVGCGTGQQQGRIAAAVAPDGLAVGLDISQAMLRITRERTLSPLCQADAGRLPFARRAFDRLYAAYVLDLLPAARLPQVLHGFARILRPGGHLTLLALTEGVNPASRTVVSLWKRLYAVSPILCGGCRPLELTALVRRSGFKHIEREVVVQFGVPSEILTAVRSVDDATESA